MSKYNILGNEEKVIDAATEISLQKIFSGAPLLVHYQQLLDDYKKLCRQTKRLIRFSDIQQQSLVSSQHELENANAHLDKINQDVVLARQEAERANLAKSAFLAGMSHELRTPLNTILGYTELLIEENEDEKNDERLKDLQKIQFAGNHLLHLINEVLDLSKIEAGKIEFYLEDFNLITTVKDIKNTIGPLLEKNKNVLEISYPSRPCVIRADFTRVQQILYNLLSNACKFTENGVIKLSLSQIRKDDEDVFEIKVADTGIGMSKEQLGHLFQKFSQADASTTRKFGGTGLGLVISRTFCRMMGGDITVTSREGLGSTFTIHLPQQVKNLT